MLASTSVSTWLTQVLLTFCSCLYKTTWFSSSNLQSLSHIVTYTSLGTILSFVFPCPSVRPFTNKISTPHERIFVYLRVGVGIIKMRMSKESNLAKIADTLHEGLEVHPWLLWLLTLPCLPSIVIDNDNNRHFVLLFHEYSWNIMTKITSMQSQYLISITQSQNIKFVL